MSIYKIAKYSRIYCCIFHRVYCKT